MFYLVPIIVFLISLVIETSVFLIFKKGDKKSLNNYRPIPVLRPIAKIVEYILSNHILVNVSDSNFISKT